MTVADRAIKYMQRWPVGTPFSPPDIFCALNVRRGSIGSHLLPSIRAGLVVKTYDGDRIHYRLTGLAS